MPLIFCRKKREREKRYEQMYVYGKAGKESRGKGTPLEMTMIRIISALRL